MVSDRQRMVISKRKLWSNKKGRRRIKLIRKIRLKKRRWLRMRICLLLSISN